MSDAVEIPPPPRLTELLGRGEFPKGYKGSRTIEQLNELFNACIRIGQEAGCPIIIENVRGAQEWVGKARWNFGSFYLFGDVPALMPIPGKVVKVGISWSKSGPGNPGQSFQTAAILKCEGNKTAGMNWSDRSLKGQDFTRIAGMQAEGLKQASESGRRTDKGKGARFTSRDCGAEGTKQAGIGGVRDNGKGDAWFQNGAARSGSKSKSRKQASAEIAKIPPALASWIARVFKPKEVLT